MPEVDQRSEKAIATLHPKLQPLARQLVLDAKLKDIEIRITSGTRTYDEQNALHAQGRTAPGRIVTNARGGFSNHNFGLAFDVTIFRNNKPVWESPHYATVGKLGKDLGLGWGGDWQGIVDEPHFELRPDWATRMSEREMLAELRRRRDRGIDPFGGPPQPTTGTPKADVGFLKTRREIGNRGAAPTSFLIELVQWARNAPRDIFEVRPDPQPPHEDIYTKVKVHPDRKPFLGPWRGERHRIAVMCAILWVLAGRESSWNWQEGKDQSNPSETTSETMSAGIFQVSYNSRHFGKDLRELLEAHAITTGEGFRRTMMADHDFAFEYTARLLRHTDEHHGPVKRREIDPYLSQEAVAEFEAHLI